jgi:threonine dehydratase
MPRPDPTGAVDRVAQPKTATASGAVPARRTLTPPDLAQIRAARERIAGTAVRTPTVRLYVDAPAEIYLKLENLQPIGSFKLRGAVNAMRIASRDELAHGVYTASAGNMAQGVAWSARELGVSCTVIVPERAPQTKIAAIERLGATIVRVPYDEWWRVMEDHVFPGMRGMFIHPVANQHCIAGAGTVGLEIAEDIPGVDAVIVPYGGGSLSCGIALALRGLGHAASVYAAEVSTAAPLAASLAAGEPRSIEHTGSFVDGIGGKSVLKEMWPLASTLLRGSVVVTPAEIMAAIRLVAERVRVIAEGAGATSVAAALTGRVPGPRIVCVVSGGNIDSERLAAILEGRMP